MDGDAKVNETMHYETRKSGLSRIAGIQKIGFPIKTLGNDNGDLRLLIHEKFSDEKNMQSVSPPL